MNIQPPCRILAVGNSAMLHDLAALLRKEGAEISHLASFAEAGDQLEQGCFELLIVDKMDEETTRFCEQPHNILIALLLEEKSADWAKLQQYKIEAFLSGDAGNAELIARIKACVRRKQAARAYANKKRLLSPIGEITC
jgi:DNA-binding response OmpR family regulator